MRMRLRRFFQQPIFGAIFVGLVALAGAGLWSLMSPTPQVEAFKNGHAGTSGNGSGTCNACHGMSPVAGISISGPASISPGSTGNQYTVILTGTSGYTNGGLDLSVAGGGTLVNVNTPGNLTKLDGVEIVHSAPKTVSGIATWYF